jgi:hypothetical protein
MVGQQRLDHNRSAAGARNLLRVVGASMMIHFRGTGCLGELTNPEAHLYRMCAGRD